MLHLRTLDWDMDPLRMLVMESDFIDRPGGRVLFTSITYFGYVGVLTALKPGLSLALNYRPLHDRSSLVKRWAYQWHRYMMLLGRRRAISSELTRIMLSPVQSPRIIANDLLPKHSTAVSITLCDGQTTLVLDNDNCGGSIRQHSDFIIAVNHDVVTGQKSYEELIDHVQEKEHKAVEHIILTRTCRQEEGEELWQRDCKTYKGISSVTEPQLINWMETCSELSNDETHFGAIMDPIEGKIVWLQRYIEPLRWYEAKY